MATRRPACLAVTIGATTRDDVKTSWSNYGSCVDLFAPGAGITSAWYDSDTAVKTISGTSMAAPHVAGVAAQYLQNNTGATPQQVRDAIYANSTKGIVTSSKTANNHLLYTGAWTSTAIKDGTLAGTVTTSSTTDGGTTTSSVQGATVTAGTKSAVTDANGHYSLSLPPDTYTVTAAATGYDTDVHLGHGHQRPDHDCQLLDVTEQHRLGRRQHRAESFCRCQGQGLHACDVELD